MTASWPRIFRDQIHGAVTFDDTPWDRLLLQLIDSREIQRLRRIKQLGMCELVFPGATHTRFAHSIGVLRNAKRFIGRIEKVSPKEVTVEQKCIVLAACLLHDVGHGPYSHMFEKISGESHEARTLEIISDPNTEVHAILSAFDKTFPEKLRIFFSETEPGSVDPVVPEYLIQIVSSQMDADRFDYLVRDSRNAGVGYGEFDADWLLDHLFVYEDKKMSTLCLSKKAFLPAEQYIFARYHMYKIVYFHKSTRSAEVMLRLLFTKVRDLSHEGPGAVAKALPDVPARLLSAIAGQKLSLLDYLSLDDQTVSYLVSLCASSPDNDLARLGIGLRDRKLFKCLDLSELAQSNPQVLLSIPSKVENILAKNKMDPRYCCAQDTAADTPYKPYDSAADDPAAQIYIRNDAEKLEEIEAMSPPIAQLTKRYSLLRYYFPAEVRDEVMSALKS